MAKRKLDMEAFVAAKVQGKTNLEAYKIAGGKGHESNASTYANKPEVKKLVKEAINEAAMCTNIALVNLVPAALNHMKEVLASTDPKLMKEKTRVAENVIGRVKDILPKEQLITTAYEVSINDEQQAVISELAELLSKQNGAGESLIATITGEAGLIEGELDGESSE